MESISNAADLIHKKFDQQFDFGIILGSGLGSIADTINDPIQLPYKSITGWPVSTVLGHKGELVMGKIGTKNVLIMRGRVHFYEGYSLSEITMPIRVMQKLGIKNMIITNAAGAVNPDFKPGEIMIIKDHLNLMGMSGENPLRGKNLEEFGPRFPDMSQAYDREMIKEMKQVSNNSHVDIKEGIYAGLAGPSFETPADLRFLKIVGVDAVGMSTVPEVIVARHGNMHVLGLSGISNKANLDGTTITSHEEVLEAGHVIAPKMVKVIIGFINQFKPEK